MVIFQLIKRLGAVVRKGLLSIILVALILNVIFGLLFYFAEHNVQEGLTIIDSFWWAMVTMTTVGYGDYYAQTFVGRFLISYPCMIIGIGIIGYLVGAVANLMVEFTHKRKRGLMDIIYKNHIIICNFSTEDKILNLFNELKANNDYSNSKFVIVTDAFNELPESLIKNKFDFVYGNPTNEDILLKAGVLHSNGVIVLAEDSNDIKSDEKSYVIGSLVEYLEKRHNISIKIITELVSNRNISNLERVSVDGCFSSEGLASSMVVQEFINPGINKVISQVVSNTYGSQLYLVDTNLYGKTIREIQIGVLNHDTNVQVIGLLSNGENILNPSKTRVVDNGDKLIVLAEKLDDFREVESDLLKK